MGTLHFCEQTANIWQILGYIVVVFKIVIPLLLIVFGMVDLGKAVVSSDEKAISKAVGTLVKRFIAAVVVFFVPTLVSALFNALGLISNKSDYNICIQCVTNMDAKVSGHGEKTCNTFADAARNGAVQ